MTTIQKETIACAICGEESEQMELGSTSAFGSPDLDTRPPPLARHAMRYWVQACPLCGYVAPGIREAGEREREVLRSAEWRELAGLPDTFSPETLEQMADRLGRMKARMIRTQWGTRETSLPGVFLRRAFIAQGLGEADMAAWATLWAAWADDDGGHEVAAAEHRRHAAALFAGAIADERAAGKDTTTPRLVRLDVLRRAALWDEAERLAVELAGASLDETLAAVLRFQRELIAKRDTACHRVADATG